MISPQANERLLFRIMAALLLLLVLAGLFFAGSKMPFQGCNLVHWHIADKVDDREFPGFCHQYHDAAYLVAIFQDINLVVLVAALFNTLDDFAPARRGELRTNAIDIGLAVLAGIVKFKA